MTTPELRDHLLNVIELERRDGQHKREEAWYWHQIGDDVIRAALLAEGHIMSVETDGVTPVAYLDRVIAALTDGHERYRNSDADEGGYGSATWWTVRRAAGDLRRRLSTSR